jgi:hypothetical protein
LGTGEIMIGDPSIVRSRAARGVARLVIVLFAVAGIALTYGTGRSHAIAPCTAHSFRPVAAVSGASGPVVAAPSGPVMVSVPQDRPDRHNPIGDGVPLAALVLLLALGLAAPRTRTGLRPLRAGLAPLPRVRPRGRAPSLAFLQVLRL